ncbi:phosphotransferase family protein [Saccharospirillum impatiens]|uniref:phosphotransferase family protein n=1 Tax=Saccharospirillum impatiens TaxID=169438 RepID=UPI00048A43F7|nr:phosphotransferase [Saccharospirillum impatiens]
MNTVELANMGKASVSTIYFEGTKAIRKTGVSPTEMYFYKSVMHQSHASQISAPHLLATEGESTLVIEYLPTLLDSEEWSSAHIVRALVKLHTAPISVEDSRLFELAWSDECTEKALSKLNREARARSKQYFQHFFEHRETIFQPIGPISGDSNIGNWGKRNSGEFVLFDWERFCLGSPAIDLAPLLPGMSNPVQVKKFCKRYLAANETCTIALADMVQQTLVAKVWIAVEVINILHDNKNQRTDEYMAWFNQVLPEWLKQTSRAL